MSRGQSIGKQRPVSVALAEGGEVELSACRPSPAEAPSPTLACGGLREREQCSRGHWPDGLAVARFHRAVRSADVLPKVPSPKTPLFAPLCQIVVR